MAEACQKCFVVQTDWKTSQNWEKKHQKEVADITKGVGKLFRERYSARIFKENKNVEQIERQTECDIIGISKGPNGECSYYVLEVAVHTKGKGLHYSGVKGNNKRADVSDDKVVAKLFNAAMSLYSNLDVTKATITFATPLVDMGLKKRIEARLKDLQDYLSRIESQDGGRFGFKFAFVGNEDFVSTILKPTRELGTADSDVSEYFLRAMKILEIAESESWKGRKKKNNQIDGKNLAKGVVGVLGEGIVKKEAPKKENAVKSFKFSQGFKSYLKIALEIVDVKDELSLMALIPNKQELKKVCLKVMADERDKKRNHCPQMAIRQLYSAKNGMDHTITMREL